MQNIHTLAQQHCAKHFSLLWLYIYVISSPVPCSKTHTQANRIFEWWYRIRRCARFFVFFCFSDSFLFLLLDLVVSFTYLFIIYLVFFHFLAVLRITFQAFRSHLIILRFLLLFSLSILLMMVMTTTIARARSLTPLLFINFLFAFFIGFVCRYKSHTYFHIAYIGRCMHTHSHTVTDSVFFIYSL